MAKHDSPASMLKESLDESLEAARFCADYKKTDKKWGEFSTGGCLGYPSAILLFSLVDTIGSYFRKDKSFVIMINGKPETIDGLDWEHFKILNSKYFNQNLSAEFIQQLYRKFRSCLTHNSVLGSDTLMFPDNTAINPKIQDQAFIIGHDESGKIIYAISIKELWNLCSRAVDLFKKDIDIIVPKSRQGKNFQK